MRNEKENPSNLSKTGRLTGIVSHRDILLLETLSDADPEIEPVEEAMTPDPMTVHPAAPLREIAAAMADGEYGSAVVVDDLAMGAP
jgi:CBS domain-containing protein